MTDKEKEAIERLNNFKTIKVLYGNTFAMHLEQLKQLQSDIETVLNLIQTQQAEIKKKDKIIDLMTEYLASIDFDEHCVEVPDICIGYPKEDDLDGYMQCIKQYFKEKVENGN